MNDNAKRWEELMKVAAVLDPVTVKQSDKGIIGLDTNNPQDTGDIDLVKLRLIGKILAL